MYILVVDNPVTVDSLPPPSPPPGGKGEILMGKSPNYKLLQVQDDNFKYKRKEGCDFDSVFPVAAA